MTSAMRVRRARKQHWADCADYHRIESGDYYLEGTEFPGGELGFADTAGRPVRLRECRACAERYGRGDLFPTSSPQADSAPCGEDAPSASRDDAPAEGAPNFFP